MAPAAIVNIKITSVRYFLLTRADGSAILAPRIANSPGNLAGWQNQ
jgi:hypothetical protein